MDNGTSRIAVGLTIGRSKKQSLQNIRPGGQQGGMNLVSAACARVSRSGNSIDQVESWVT